MATKMDKCNDCFFVESVKIFKVTYELEFFKERITFPHKYFKGKDTAGRETLASPVQEPRCGFQLNSTLLDEREGQAISTRTNTQVDNGEIQKTEHALVKILSFN